MSEKRVIVVGTTADYIEIISTRYPGRCLFITDPAERGRHPGNAPGAGGELLCGLEDEGRVIAALKAHLAARGFEASGVACFDCESLMLAALVARELGLPYPTPESVALCRSKYATRKRWREDGVPCPEAALARTIGETVDFFERAGGPVVMKPLSGSGSELVTLCRDRSECERAFALLTERMSAHSNARMYSSVGPGGGTDPRTAFVVETFVSGTEFSCDFTVDGNDLEIIRVAGKIMAPDQSMGTTLAYVLPGELPGGMGREALAPTLMKAARALGLRRAIAMVDFIISEGGISLLEMTPRPGGDCLPDLIMESSGFDTLGAALDFAEGKKLKIPPAGSWRKLIGLRLIASREGILKRLDCGAIVSDGRVLSCRLKRGPGDRVVLPPLDYDSRILGHVIFEAPEGARSDAGMAEIGSKLRVEYA